MSCTPYTHPTQEDDGFTLYEVRAIARYICDKYSNQGTPLLPDPADLRARALVEQAISVEMTHFEPPAQNAFFEGILKKQVFP
jgi:glutathione S-transferase